MKIENWWRANPVTLKSKTMLIVCCIFSHYRWRLAWALKNIPSRLTDESRYLIESAGTDYLYAYTTLSDIKGDAALLLKAKVPKNISKKGHASMHYAMYSFLPWEIEEKLARSKRMESLGLMAGGITHDLNNIFAGIVSYPDLLLIDLPENRKDRHCR